MKTVAQFIRIAILVALAAGLTHGQTCDVTFTDAVHYPVGSRPFSVALGDLDGDSDLDIIVANCSSSDTSVLINIGGGDFADQLRFPVGDQPLSIFLGDLDGDSDLDLAFANSVFTQPDTSVLFNLCTSGATCLPDLNNDGELNFFDVSAFLSAFAAGDPIADFSGDGMFNFFDVSAFLGAFAAGCP